MTQDPRTLPSSTSNLSLSEVASRLTARREVAGLLTIGSTSREEVTPVSDYDLIVVLRESPVPLSVALTYIDHRLTDVVFVLATDIEKISGQLPGSAEGQWGEARVIHWLRAGQILYDRAGILETAQAIAKSRPEAVATDEERYAAWFNANYNLRQTRRMLASDDPAYQMAVDLRLLFSMHDLWRFYFIVRRLTLHGDKEQARFMQTNDPDFLHAFRYCLTEEDRRVKFHLYERLVKWALAPIGDLWEEGTTSVMPIPSVPWHANTPTAALAFWQSLVAV
jgi:predicted nucleotidyltransferase